MVDVSAPNAWTGARLRGAPARLILALVSVECVALALTINAMTRTASPDHVVVRMTMLVVLSAVFEEIALQVGKLRLLISTGPQPDMTSVWTFAAALVLPGPWAALVAVIIAVSIWLRRQRAAGQYLYRKVYSAATVMLACLGAGEVRVYMEGHLKLPGELNASIAIAIAAIGYTGINRLLIVSAAHLANPRAPISIVGTWTDNGLELSTLCLGAMTSVVLSHQAALTALVLLPMILLQRGALIKQLETAAAIDAKTGLLNAVAWQQAATRELERARREETTVGLLLLDLDHFKIVNDKYGHLVGDAALRMVGATLKQELRPYDVIGRFGGEEFVALLPGIGARDANAIAERIRAAIASIAMSDIPGAANSPRAEQGGSKGLAASVGVAYFPAHGDDLEAVLSTADAALYMAKSAGRNRVATYEPADRGRP